jgi:hypothetical protein
MEQPRGFWSAGLSLPVFDVLDYGGGEEVEKVREKPSGTLYSH